MNPGSRPQPIPLIPKLFFAGLGLLALSWLVFMLHYVFIGSKQDPPPGPIRSSTQSPAKPSP